MEPERLLQLIKREAPAVVLVPRALMVEMVSLLFDTSLPIFLHVLGAPLRPLVLKPSTHLQRVAYLL